MEFFVMRKDEALTIADFSDTGDMLWYSKNIRHPELLPLWEGQSSNHLQQWWKERSVPITQSGVKEILQKQGLETPGEYLLKNLGLSLTDYYWIKPAGSDLQWADVNLYDNDFSEAVFMEKEGNIDTLSPNGSLQGQLQKTWIIGHDGGRYLVKGNRDDCSAESMNEVLATMLHQKQKFKNHTEYQLYKVKGASYDFGCISKAFTSQQLELIPAYAIVSSKKKPNDISTYEFFLKVCGEHGCDVDELRHQMEYQILSDFVMSGVDRHLNNVGVLRDADTLQIIGMAPIFDSGKSLFAGTYAPQTTQELLKLRVSSFAQTELKLLGYVRDRYALDASRLLSPEDIRKIYRMDTQMPELKIDQICKAYEMKIDLFEQYQHGADLNKMKKILPAY